MTKKKIQTEPLALEEPQANEVKEESSEEKPVEKPIEEPKSDKIQKSKTITCPNCKKNMLEKTFKYYHSLKCHPASICAKPPGSVAQQSEPVAHHVVDFGFTQRLQARRDKYTNLFSRAT